LPAERFLTPAEALGEDVVAALAELEDQVRQLDLLVANADLTEKLPHPMDSVALGALVKYVMEHLEEQWATAPTSDGRTICIDDVPRLDEREVGGEAIVYPVIHMQLLGWWLAHAWRFIDLVGTAIESLDSWNVTTAAIASRALIEEVSCVSYEANEISKRWSEAKSLPAENRDVAVGNSLHGKLLEFTYASRGLGDALGDPEPWSALNVLTYIDKLAKRYGDKGLREYYDILSNAAHPARYAKQAYQIRWSTHETGAYFLRRLSRRPRAAGLPADLEFPIASGAAGATIEFGGIGQGLLRLSLRIVDDFGLTTRSGLLTLYPYWRKLMPGRSSSDACPCGCGKWGAAKHRWGQPAPEIRLTP
jgi:hypothetical protein